MQQRDDLKGETWIDTSNLAVKSDLANLKAGLGNIYKI